MHAIATYTPKPYEKTFLSSKRTHFPQGNEPGIFCFSSSYSYIISLSLYTAPVEALGCFVLKYN